jgi:glycosyltransferase involved in cell wall biosynthesis
MLSVCMISSLHGLYDDRIYWKEALSLKNSGYQVTHVGIGEEDRDFTSEHGIRLIMVKKKRYFQNPFLDILYRKLTFRPNIYRKVLAVCRSLESDVYHFHDLQINKIGKELCELPHKPRVIYDVHEDYAASILSGYEDAGFMKVVISIYTMFLRRWELSKAVYYDYIIPAYVAIENVFKRRVPENRIGIILNYTTLSPVLDITNTERSFDALYCGLINKFRGPMELLEASVILKKRMPAVRILFLGPVPDPALRKQMEVFIGENELQDNVILKDTVPYEEMDHYYRISKIGLGIFMPTRIFYTAVQIKTFEYMAYGLPIVCSNFGSINRYTTENNCGIPVNPKSPVEIADALYKLLNDRDLYIEMAGNGMEAVQNKYHWKYEEVKLLEIYRMLLKDKL